MMSAEATGSLISSSSMYLLLELDLFCSLGGLVWKGQSLLINEFSV